MAVAWLLQERDFSTGITSVVFHNRTSSSGGVTARRMELMLALTQQPQPGGTKLIGPFESGNTHTDIDEALHGIFLGQTRKIKNRSRSIAESIGHFKTSSYQVGDVTHPTSIHSTRLPQPFFFSSLSPPTGRVRPRR